MKSIYYIATWIYFAGTVCSKTTKDTYQDEFDWLIFVQNNQSPTSIRHADLFIADILLNIGTIDPSLLTMTICRSLSLANSLA